MNETTKIVDHLAVQSDRYLFIATLIVLGFFAYIVMRYFLKQYESLITDHKEARASYHVSMQNIVSQQDVTTRSVVATLTETKEIIRQNSEALRDCTEVMRDHLRQ
jgi:hypothetical protein